MVELESLMHGDRAQSQFLNLDSRNMKPPSSLLETLLERPIRLYDWLPCVVR